MNEAEDITLGNPRTSKYVAGQKIVLKNGQSATILGVDPINNLYQLMTLDNKSISVKGTEIKKLEKPKHKDYQPSGVDPEDQTQLNIKDTPFDLDQEK